MLTEVVGLLSPRAGGVYLDGTFGGGGYTSAFLEAAPCTVWAIDRDPEAIARGASLAARFPGRLHLIHGQFGDMLDLLAGMASPRWTAWCWTSACRPSSSVIRPAAFRSAATARWICA